MEGYNGKNKIEYYLIVLNKNKHIWKRYDPFGDVSLTLLPIDILYDIYGNMVTKLNKKDIRQLIK